MKFTDKPAVSMPHKFSTSQRTKLAFATCEIRRVLP